MVILAALLVKIFFISLDERELTIHCLVSTAKIKYHINIFKLTIIGVFEELAHLIVLSSGGIFLIFLVESNHPLDVL